MYVKMSVHKFGFARPGLCVVGAKRVLILFVRTPRKGEKAYYLSELGFLRLWD